MSVLKRKGRKDGAVTDSKTFVAAFSHPHAAVLNHPHIDFRLPENSIASQLYLFDILELHLKRIAVHGERRIAAKPRHRLIYSLRPGGTSPGYDRLDS